MNSSAPLFRIGPWSEVLVPFSVPPVIVVPPR
jgi:hypothetical protein